MIKINYVDYRVIFFITSSLSTYVEAGLPLTKSLELIRASLNNLTYKNSLDRIINNLKNGETLSDAMAKEKKLYPALMIDMLKIGEESGRIDEVLVKISQHFNKRNEISSSIKKIIMYPIFLSTSIVTVTIIYLFYILPSFEQLYKDLDSNSSLVISKIIDYIDFMNNNEKAELIILCYIGVVILIMVFILFSLKGKNLFMRIAAVKKYYELNLIFMLELIISSGVSVRRALDLIVDTITCPITKDYFTKIKKSLWKGQSLSQAINSIEIISTLSNMFIFSGEESGKLENSIKILSNLLNEEFTNEVNSIKNKIEPLMILILGIMVLGMVLMVFIPMYGYMTYV